MTCPRQHQEFNNLNHSDILSRMFIFSLKYESSNWRIPNKIVAAFRGMHVSPAKHSFGKCDRRTDDGQSDPYVSLCFAGDTKIVAAFLGMHVSPAKHSFGKWDRQTDDGQSDPYVSLCFAGDTKIPWHKRVWNSHHRTQWCSPLQICWSCIPILFVNHGSISCALIFRRCGSIRS